MNAIGHTIMTFVMPNPAETLQCVPCQGPRGGRYRWKSTFHPYKEKPLCVCDGHGYCVHTLDIGPRRTLRCTCLQNCLDYPRDKWCYLSYFYSRVVCAKTSELHKGCRDIHNGFVRSRRLQSETYEKYLDDACNAFTMRL